MRPPVETLVELARRHAVYCRRDIAGVMAALRVEFGARDHPVGDAVRQIMVDLIARVRTQIEQGRADGTIPPGPPARPLAAAALAAIEGAVIVLAGHPGDDEEAAERIVRGLLGVPRPLTRWTRCAERVATPAGETARGHDRRGGRRRPESARARCRACSTAAR